MTNRHASIEERIQKLERQNRRMKLVGLGLVIVVGATGVLSSAASNAARVDVGNSSATIRAAGFVLVDAQGRERASLEMRNGQPQLVMNNSDGAFAAGIGVALSGPQIVLDDLNGKTRARLIVSSNGPALFLDDPNEQPRIMLDALPNGPELDLFGAKGQRRATLGALSDEPGLGLYDPQGFGANIGVSDLLEANGNKRRTSAASILLLGKDRAVLWTAPPQN